MAGNLTKNADTLIKLMYKMYRQRLDNGESQTQAKLFDGHTFIQETIVPEWNLEEVNAALANLSDLGLLNCLYGDGAVQHCSITVEGISYAEDK